jgi:hypothetical protein
MSRSVGRNTPLSDREAKACEPRQWSAISVGRNTPLSDSAIKACEPRQWERNQLVGEELRFS